MSVMQIRKVTSLPGTLEASTIYLLTNADASQMSMYVSNKFGTGTRRVPNKDDVMSWIATSLGGHNSATIVADITARNAMALTANTQVIVLDATGDPTVTLGAATYVYQVSNTTWHKISEAESMDVVLQWANISGKPSSTADDIDAAVGVRHSHTNKTTLDLISESSNELQFRGAPVRAFLDEEAW